MSHEEQDKRMEDRFDSADRLAKYSQIFIFTTWSTLLLMLHLVYFSESQHRILLCCLLNGVYFSSSGYLVYRMRKEKQKAGVNDYRGYRQVFIAMFFPYFFWMISLLWRLFRGAAL